MQTVAVDVIRKVAELTASGLSPEDLEATALQLVGEHDLARRVIDWLPEAFGIALVSHMGSITLPRTFLARDGFGSWVEIPFSKDPIFGQALELAQHMHHHGPREIFSALALRSSVLATVNQALNAGESVDGSILSPPCMLGLAADAYRGGP